MKSSRADLAKSGAPPFLSAPHAGEASAKNPRTNPASRHVREPARDSPATSTAFILLLAPLLADQP